MTQDTINLLIRIFGEGGIIAFVLFLIRNKVLTAITKKAFEMIDQIGEIKILKRDLSTCWAKFDAVNSKLENVELRLKEIEKDLQL